MESLLTDTPNKGHCIKSLSIMDKTKSPNFNLPINWNLLIEDTLYTVDKSLEFILVPKCPLFGVSTIVKFIAKKSIMIMVLHIPDFYLMRSQMPIGPNSSDK